MKKKLLVAALGLMSVGASAQILQEKTTIPYGNFYGIPYLFGNGDNYLVVESDTDIEYDYRRIYSIYDDNLSLIKKFTTEGSRCKIYVTDSSKGYEDNSFVLSQTLFNDDDAFEYIESDCTPIEDEDYREKSTYFRVVSDNGKEVTRVNFDKPVYTYDIEFELIVFGTKNFLYVDAVYVGEDYQTNPCRKLYLVDENAGGQDAIREVEAPELLKAFPSLARKNQSVSIELGENAGSSLQVTAANGSVVRRVPVKDGQKTVQLSTRGLAAGMYVVSTVGADGTQENCKIVVK